MFTVIFLLLVGALVYVLWFHKFTMPDGTEVKGFLAKYKAEHNADPKDNPKQVLDDLVATARQSKAVETAVQAAKDLTAKAKGEKKENPAELKVEKENTISVECTDQNGETSVKMTTLDENNPSGLSITSTPEDFEKVLQEAIADPFEKAWDLMEGYFGWLLLGAARNDEINRDNIWTIMSNGSKSFKESLYDYYREQGKYTEENLWIMPAWVANAHLNNAIGFFAVNAHRYFSPDEWSELHPRIADWYAAFQEESAKTQGLNITEQPNAAKWLAKLFTILRGEDDSMAAYNEVEYFEVTSDFDVYLPQPEVKGGISA